VTIPPITISTLQNEFSTIQVKAVSLSKKIEAAWASKKEWDLTWSENYYNINKKISELKEKVKNLKHTHLTQLTPNNPSQNSIPLENLVQISYLETDIKKVETSHFLNIFPSVMQQQVKKFKTHYYNYLKSKKPNSNHLLFWAQCKIWYENEVISKQHILNLDTFSKQESFNSIKNLIEEVEKIIKNANCIPNALSDEKISWETRDWEKLEEFLKEDMFFKKAIYENLENLKNLDGGTNTPFLKFKNSISQLQNILDAVQIIKNSKDYQDPKLHKAIKTLTMNGIIVDIENPSHNMIDTNPHPFTVLEKRMLASLTSLDILRTSNCSPASWVIWGNRDSNIRKEIAEIVSEITKQASNDQNLQQIESITTRYAALSLIGQIDQKYIQFEKAYLSENPPLLFLWSEIACLLNEIALTKKNLLESPSYAPILENFNNPGLKLTALGSWVAAELEQDLEKAQTKLNNINFFLQSDLEFKDKINIDLKNVSFFLEKVNFLKNENSQITHYELYKKLEELKEYLSAADALFNSSNYSYPDLLSFFTTYPHLPWNFLLLKQREGNYVLFQTHKNFIFLYFGKLKKYLENEIKSMNNLNFINNLENHLPLGLEYYRIKIFLFEQNLNQFKEFTTPYAAEFTTEEQNLIDALFSDFNNEKAILHKKTELVIKNKKLLYTNIINKKAAPSQPELLKNSYTNYLNQINDLYTVNQGLLELPEFSKINEIKECLLNLINLLELCSGKNGQA
jgi:hypothetical protein